MPGCKGDLQLNARCTADALGQLGGDSAAAALYESVVELHNNDQYDLDMTLVRGRVIVASRSDKAVGRARAATKILPWPTASKSPTCCCRARARKSSSTVSASSRNRRRSSRIPTVPSAVPPAAFQGFCVVKGTVMFRHGDVAYTLTGPPGRALLVGTAARA